ncbi:MAG: hypothetical protein ACLFPL_04935 [Candidatus Nanoarchaeia archaeon]
MTILLAYRNHSNREGVECGIISPLEHKLKELESEFGELRTSSQFDPLGFENIDSTDLYVPLIYSTHCLEGTHMEKRFQREFEHFPNKDVFCVALIKSDLQIPQYGVCKPSIAEVIRFEEKRDLLEKIQKYVLSKVDGSRKAA